MTTKQDLIAQCKAENPTMTATINDEPIELTADEYEKACNDWAEMRLVHLKYEAAEAQAIIDKAEQDAQAATDKTALLARMGLTADEAKLLLS